MPDQYTPRTEERTGEPVRGLSLLVFTRRSTRDDQVVFFREVICLGDEPSRGDVYARVDWRSFPRDPLTPGDLIVCRVQLDPNRGWRISQRSPIFAFQQVSVSGETRQLASEGALNLNGLGLPNSIYVHARNNLWAFLRRNLEGSDDEVVTLAERIVLNEVSRGTNDLWDAISLAPESVLSAFRVGTALRPLADVSIPLAYTALLHRISEGEASLVETCPIEVLVEGLRRKGPKFPHFDTAVFRILEGEDSSHLESILETYFSGSIVSLGEKWASTRSLAVHHPLSYSQSLGSFLTAVSEADHLAIGLVKKRIERRVDNGAQNPLQVLRRFDHLLDSVGSDFDTQGILNDLARVLGPEHLLSDFENDFAESSPKVIGIAISMIEESDEAPSWQVLQRLASQSARSESTPLWLSALDPDLDPWEGDWRIGWWHVLSMHLRTNEIVIPPKRASWQPRFLSHLLQVGTSTNRQDGDVKEIFRRMKRRLEEEWQTSLDRDVIIDDSPLLPHCFGSAMIDHCEARFKLVKSEEGSWIQTSDVDCSRRHICHHVPKNGKRDHFGHARLLPRISLPWWEWSLAELFEYLQIEPEIFANAVNSGPTDRYLAVNRLGAVANRSNELRERLRCRSCGVKLRANLKYAKNPSFYLSTTSEPCSTGAPDCDQAVYIHHCNGCRQIIDSRDSRFKDRGGYYVCINCASGSDPTRAGSMCPKCGKIGTLRGVTREKNCNTCGHHVQLPHRAVH